MQASQLGSNGVLLPISGPALIPTFDHVLSYMLDVLHWFPLQQRIVYRMISLIGRSLLGLAPVYLRDLCCTTIGIPSHRSLRSTERGFSCRPFYPRYN